MHAKIFSDVFNFGHDMGIGVSLEPENAERMRHAVRFIDKDNITPEVIVQGLRLLADWVEKHGVK